MLISTGSKELHLYTRIKDYKERCFARVLSTQEAVAEAVRLGFEGKHLIAMQGPYSEELNLAMLKHINAAYFVTKESGGAGGFEEKKKAAQKAGAELIVIARPKEEGKSLQEVKNLWKNSLQRKIFYDILRMLQKKHACGYLRRCLSRRIRTVSEENKTCGSKKTNLEERNMGVISMKQLLEAGVHFGHQTRRWNPKMAPYIYTERNGIYIIDLQKSVGKVDEAYDAVSDIAAQGGTILFVGTKKQAQDAIKTEAERCGMYYVNERWLGGMLTNFRTIESRIARLKAIETMSEDGTFDVLPKKEVIALKKEWEKLEKNLGGIKDMKRIPDAIFVVDPKKERICIKEAQALGITLIGIADTNCDPDELDYVIPGNDDAIRAVKLIVSKMADAVIEAKQGAEEEVTAEEASDETVEE